MSEGVVSLPFSVARYLVTAGSLSSVPLVLCRSRCIQLCSSSSVPSFPRLSSPGALLVPMSRASSDARPLLLCLASLVAHATKRSALFDRPELQTLPVHVSDVDRRSFVHLESAASQLKSEEVSSGPTPVNVVGPSPTPTPVPSNCGSKRADIDISSDTISEFDKCLAATEPSGKNQNTR